MIPLRFGQGNVDWQQRVNWEELRKKRVDKAHKFLAKYGLGAAIVYNHDRKRYLTSVFNHVYGKHVPTSFALLIRDAGFPYVTIEKELDEVRIAEDCPWLAGRVLTEEELLQPAPYRFQTPEVAKEQWATTAGQVKALLKKHGVADMPVSVDYCSPYLIDALKEAGLKVVDGNNWIDECGMVKFDEEVLLMKMAAACTEAGYGAVYRDARVGMRENEVQGIMAKAIYQAGGEYMEGWVINAGDRTNPRSFNWSDRPLRPQEFLTLEACHVNYCGYKLCYDRTFLVGTKPTEIQKEVYQTVVEMQAKLSALLKPGVTTRQLAEWRPKPGENFKTSEQIKKWRGKWSNHLGGMGIAWDTPPYFYTEKDPEFVLEKNMTLAYHAIFCAEGEAGGAAIENTYLITETGCESLTKWPYEEIMTIGFRARSSSRMSWGKLMGTEGRLLGLKAIVTGAAQGIGAVIAGALAREGASVAVADVNLEGAIRVASDIEKLGVAALALRVDVTRSDQVAGMIEQVLEKWGAIDILVNNAGGFTRLTPISETSEAEWDLVVAVNLKGTFLCCRAVAAPMVERQKGRIINIASESALGPNPFTAPYVPYGAAKAGVVGLTKHLAKELAPYGVTVNAVSPGTALTDRVIKVRGAEGLKKMAETNPMKHLVEPRDIAEAVVYLASEAGRFVTGVNLNVNGGNMMV